MVQIRQLLKRCVPFVLALFVFLTAVPVLPVSALVLDESPEEPAALQGFSTSISVDGEVFLFSSQLAAPKVTIAVTATGCMLTDDLNVHTWTYTGDGEFLGISLSPDGDNLVPVGSYVECPGNSSANVQYTFYAIESSSSSLKAILSAGQWECKSLVMTGELVDLEPWPEGFYSQDISFSSNGKDFDRMSYQLDAAYGYCLFYDETLVYKYSDLIGQADPSWVNKAYSLIYLESDQLVSQEFFDWFTTCFARVGSDVVEPTYCTTVNIYDSTGMVNLHTFTFTGEGAAPAPFIEVTNNGCTIYSGDQSTSWTTTEACFGFSFGQASSAIYAPGTSYVLPGGGPADLVIDLYVVDAISLDYCTLVVIDDQVFEFAGESEYPVVVVKPNQTSVTLMCNSPYITYTWQPTPPQGQSFKGFSLYSDGSTLDFPVGDGSLSNMVSLPGSETQNVYFLYPVYDSSSGSGSGSDDGPGQVSGAISGMISSLFSPLAGFFAIEFLPGFSFGRICLFAFLIGLLFWFLRMAK